MTSTTSEIPENHRGTILWAGNLPDIQCRLTVILPEVPVTCEHAEPEDIILLYHLGGYDIDHTNHFHLDEEGYKNFAEVFPFVLQQIKTEFYTIVSQQVIDQVRYGTGLH